MVWPSGKHTGMAELVGRLLDTGASRDRKCPVVPVSTMAVEVLEVDVGGEDSSVVVTGVLDGLRSGLLSCSHKLEAPLS